MCAESMQSRQDEEDVALASPRDEDRQLAPRDSISIHRASRREREGKLRLHFPPLPTPYSPFPIQSEMSTNVANTSEHNVDGLI